MGCSRERDGDLENSRAGVGRPFIHADATRGKKKPTLIGRSSLQVGVNTHCNQERRSESKAAPYPRANAFGVAPHEVSSRWDHWTQPDQVTSQKIKRAGD